MKKTTEIIVSPLLASIEGEFVQTIDTLAYDSDSIIDAIILFAERENLEVEALVPIIKKHPAFCAKIQCEAEGLNWLPKSRRLPI